MSDKVLIKRELLERLADIAEIEGQPEGAQARALLTAQPQASAAQSAPAGEREPVAYVLTRDGEVCYEADDGIVISNTPGDETDLCKWQPVYFGAAQQSEPDRVSVSVELLQDLHDLASDAVEHHRAAFAGYKLKRQANMEGVVDKARALLASHAEGGKV